MEAAAARIADAIVRGEKVAIFGDYDVDGATSSALLARLSAPLRARSAHPHPRPHLRGLRPERRGDPRARRRRRDAARHRRLRHHQPSSRWPRRSKLGLDVVVIDHHQADDELPDGDRDRQSEPAGRSLRPRPSRRGRRRVHDAGRGEPRIAPARLLDRRAAGARSARHRSIWSRSAPSPTWCR